MTKPRFETPDLTAANIGKIAALFPSVITEALDEERSTSENKVYKKAVNFESLKTLLGDENLNGNEAYEFTWVGKKASVIEANRPIRETLRPCREESRDWDTTRNLYIEGDNLEVLKLLQESYLGQVKMIYIDPPYNTGNDFVYRDDFRMDKDEYDKEAGMFDEGENRLFRNKESNGRFHSDWCSMIYPRLILARNLLCNDGVIFISIDDNEVAQLRKICDEVFGEYNFVATICHKSRASISNDKIISTNHNSVLFYGKKLEIIHEKRHQFGLSPDLDGFNLEDENGKYKLVPVDGPGGASKGNPSYEFLGITGYWRFGRDTMERKYKQGLIVKTANNLQQKYYLSQAQSSRKTTTTWFDDGYLTSNATKQLKELMGGDYFNNPKNIKLILAFLEMTTHYDKKSIILDFFSGSATTAHAVMQLNAEDGGNRKFIMVQLPEPCEKDSEAAKAGYKNICEIGKERIRRAGNKIREETGLNGQNFDIGFRVFKVADSNMKDVYYSAGEYKQKDLDLFVSNIKEDRTALDLLYGCLLDWGLTLDMPHTEETIDGFAVHIVYDENKSVLLAACFDEGISEKVLTMIAKKKPLRAIFRDSGFSSDPAKINLFEIFKLHAPDTQVKVI